MNPTKNWGWTHGLLKKKSWDLVTAKWNLCYSMNCGKILFFMIKVWDGIQKNFQNLHVYRQHTIITNKVLKKSYEVWTKQTWVIFRSEKSLISFYKQSPIIILQWQKWIFKIERYSTFINKNFLKFGHSKFIVSCMYGWMDDRITLSTSIQGLV